MRRRSGIRSFCHGVDSTSTTMQRRLVGADAASSSFLTVPTSTASSVGVAESEAAAAVTLEQMILQLDLEEAAARKAQQQQHPRPPFYHDGGLASSSSGHRRSPAPCRGMPPTVARESVVWCKPGVVAKLMGLDAVPVPVRGGGQRRGGAAATAGGRRKASGAPPLASVIAGGGGRKRRGRRTGREEEELEKERLFMALHGYDVAVARALPRWRPSPQRGPQRQWDGQGCGRCWGFRLPH
ncbi:hypothetical protein OsJ_01176 [Oryza sativa Japonica Group]|uniref:DUF3741 domain-containing protein n=1 Tax=Oryza sativa subsp. japonica TaxID=39947 RepID=B9EV23_ORYSJ|nr:hypothetical protein OsJ_01176 [Oryza sativa Japonica Group]